MAKIQRSFYIEEETAKWLKVTAAEMGWSASEMISYALQYYQHKVLPFTGRPPSATEARAMLDITDSLE